jgi:hypothetical protein
MLEGIVTNVLGGVILAALLGHSPEAQPRKAAATLGGGGKTLRPMAPMVDV